MTLDVTPVIYIHIYIYYTLCLLPFRKIISAVTQCPDQIRGITLYTLVYTLLNLPLVPVRAVSSRHVWISNMPSRNDWHLLLARGNIDSFPFPPQRSPCDTIFPVFPQRYFSIDPFEIDRIGSREMISRPTERFYIREYIRMYVYAGRS